LGLPDNSPAMVLFDASKGQTTDATYQLLEQNDISVVIFQLTAPVHCNPSRENCDLNMACAWFICLSFNWLP